MYGLVPFSGSPFASFANKQIAPKPTVEVIPFWQQTILSQYDASPTLLSMIESFNDAIDPTANIAAFYENIWNVNTANGYGLDVWGQIVGVSRYLQVSASNYLGFDEAYTARLQLLVHNHLIKLLLLLGYQQQLLLL